MKELGEYLKRTRISSGVSIAEAAEDLDFSTSQLENIEDGNVRAFKDVYNLKQYIKQYAKYLGLDAGKVVDEFDSFLFEHTSKISLDDIKAAQKKMEEKDNKVKSPYTTEYKKRLSVWPFVLGFVLFICLCIAIYFIISNVNKTPTRIEELMPVGGKENIYEFTY